MPLPPKPSFPPSVGHHETGILSSPGGIRGQGQLHYTLNLPAAPALTSCTLAEVPSPSFPHSSSCSCTPNPLPKGQEGLSADGSQDLLVRADTWGWACWSGQWAAGLVPLLQGGLWGSLREPQTVHLPAACTSQSGPHHCKCSPGMAHVTEWATHPSEMGMCLGLGMGLPRNGRQAKSAEPCRRTCWQQVKNCAPSL